MTDAIRDQNFITVALGVSSSSASVTLPFTIDGVTGRLYVDSAPNNGWSTTGNTITGGVLGTLGATSFDIITNNTVRFTFSASAATITTTGNFTLTSSTVSETVTIGNAARTGTMNIGISSDTNTINVGTGTGTTIINIGTGAAGTRAITIGNLVTGGNIYYSNTTHQLTSNTTNVATFTSSAANSDSIAIAPSTGGGTGFIGVITSDDLSAGKTWTFPNTTGNIVIDVATQTLTNKTLTAPTIGGAATLADAATLSLVIPTVDGTCTGPTTSEFVSGYTSSAVGDLVILDSSGKWQKTDANTSSIYDGILGIALTVAATNATLKVALPGSFVYATGFPTLTVGGTCYMSETAGAITQTKPTTTDAATRVIGFAIHADKIFFNPSGDYITHT